MSENEIVESKETFINYLNNEIDQIREDIKMPGWTNWAVMATLASMGWFIILEFEKRIFNIEQVFLLYIIVSLVYAVLRELYDYLKPNQPNKRIRYFTVEVLFSERKLTIFINSIQICLMIFLILHFSIRVGVFPYYLSLLHYGFGLFSPVFVLIIKNSLKSFTNTNFYIPDPENYSIPFGIPLPKRNNKIVMNLYVVPVVAMVIINIYLLLSYSLLYINLFSIVLNNSTFSNLKIAILVPSIFLLLRLLVYSDQSSPTLKELVNIRRDLMFGNIDLDMAKKLTEISISGLNKSAIIQREITNSIITLQGIDAELNKAAQKNQIASSQLHQEKSGENIETQQTLWETLRDATLVHLRQARRVYLSDKSLRGGLIRFLKVYAFVEPNDTDFIASIRKMDELYAEVKKKYDKTIYEWLILANKYEDATGSNKWRDIAIKELAFELPQERDNEEVIITI